MAGNKNLAEDPYERLANAIILQAVTQSRTMNPFLIHSRKIGFRQSRTHTLKTDQKFRGTVQTENPVKREECGCPF